MVELCERAVMAANETIESEQDENKRRPLQVAVGLSLLAISAHRAAGERNGPLAMKFIHGYLSFSEKNTDAIRRARETEVGRKTVAESDVLFFRVAQELGVVFTK